MLLGVVNTKGGQGKTTWACSLASHLDAELLDANPENGDAKAWAEIGGHPCRTVYPNHLSLLEEAARSRTWSVVDCPPWDGPETRAALAHSQAVLAPIGAGYQDLRGMARILDLFEEARGINSSLRILLVGNGRRAVAFSETWDAALQGVHRPKHGVYYLGSLPLRQAIVDAFGAGRPSHQAAEPAGMEVREILTKIDKLLKTK